MDAISYADSFVTLAVLCVGLLVVAWHDRVTARATSPAPVSVRRGVVNRPR